MGVTGRSVPLPRRSIVSEAAQIELVISSSSTVELLSFRASYCTVLNKIRVVLGARKRATKVRLIPKTSDLNDRHFLTL